MKSRLWALAVATLAAAAACFDVTSSSHGTLIVQPILDSVFVGDSLPPRNVFLLDAYGQLINHGPVTWTITPTTVATISATTGEIHGVGRGGALVTATASGDSARALVVVSRPLDLTLLMDTVYLMPGDTFTIPLAIEHKSAARDTIRFDPSANAAVYAIDTTTGLVTAVTTGAVPYVAHVRNGISTVADTGAIVVMTLVDTAGAGHFFLTAVGANTRHEGGGARAQNYPKLDATLAFLLIDTLVVGPASAPVREQLLLARPESISAAPAAYGIDTINPQEAATTTLPSNNVFCNPPRVWAIWSSSQPTTGVAAYSHAAGTLAGLFSVTQRIAVNGGYVISGRYAFTAQRGDFYFDPLGVVTIHGTFVAPLITSTASCRSQ